MIKKQKVMNGNGRTVANKKEIQDDLNNGLQKKKSKHP